MKNIIVFLFIISIWSCKTSKPISRWDLIFKGPISSNQNPKLVSNENRTSKDSLNFVVIHGKYISGSKHVAILQDKNTKLYHWKEFHPNGKLKEKGLITKDNIFCVGTWEYYNENGKIDSIVDFDKKIKVSYFKAIKIAHQNGYKLPELEVDIEKIENKTYWQIRKWNMKNGSGNSTTLLIDTESGKIRKPKYEETLHY
ncbi:hypothetical protein [Flavobacterium sp. J27]|uniref:hypothetical protein n=1 Tax=Flavobacterium sp. J27 TaxID=2060419 RepID=UPI0010309BE3|nr:hypothetical protein [Flavobacterium sp. J27]